MLRSCKKTLLLHLPPQVQQRPFPRNKTKGEEQHVALSSKKSTKKTYCWTAGHHHLRRNYRLDPHILRNLHHHHPNGAL